VQIQSQKWILKSTRIRDSKKTLHHLDDYLSSFKL
jgi:hypothetical protein